MGGRDKPSVYGIVALTAATVRASTDEEACDPGGSGGGLHLPRMPAAARLSVRPLAQLPLPAVPHAPPTCRPSPWACGGSERPRRCVLRSAARRQRCRHLPWRALLPAARVAFHDWSSVTATGWHRDPLSNPILGRMWSCARRTLERRACPSTPPAAWSRVSSCGLRLCTDGTGCSSCLRVRFEQCASRPAQPSRTCVELLAQVQRCGHNGCLPNFPFSHPPCRLLPLLPLAWRTQATAARAPRRPACWRATARTRVRHPAAGRGRCSCENFALPASRWLLASVAAHPQLQRQLPCLDIPCAV